MNFITVLLSPQYVVWLHVIHEHAARLHNLDDQDETRKKGLIIEDRKLNIGMHMHQKPFSSDNNGIL